MPGLAEHRAVDAALRAAVAAGEPRLRRAYARALGRVGRGMADRLADTAVTLTAAGWVVPDADELARLDAEAEQVRAETDPVRRRIVADAMRSALAEYGISFDVSNPVASKLLDNLGRHITQITDDQRQAVMSELRAAYDDGESIPQAAARIRSAGAGIAKRRAVTIARTEIIGASNGGSLAVARTADVSAYKQWLTAPGAEHPRHELYDDLDGQTVPLDAQFDVGGAMLAYPGDQAGPAGEVINCRCTLSYTDTLVAAAEEDAMPDPLPEYPRAVTGRVERILTAAGRASVSGTLMFVDTPTGDGRQWAAAGMSVRPLPLPLQAMFTDDHGSGAPLESVNVGQIDSITTDGKRVLFTGELNDDPQTGGRAAAAIESGDLPGISVDTAATEWEVTYPAAGDGVDESTMMDLMLGENAEPVTVTEGVEDYPQVVFTAWEVLGGTQVPHPAFADARVQVDAPVTASGDVERAAQALEAATLADRAREVYRLRELDIISVDEARVMIGLEPRVASAAPAADGTLADTLARLAERVEAGESSAATMAEMLDRLRARREVVTRHVDAEGNVQYVKTYEEAHA